MRTSIAKLMLLTSVFAFAPVIAAETTYTLDKDHSYVGWHINHLGFSNQTGKWMATGTLKLDKDHLDQSKVDVSIDIKKIITGNPELDKHLSGQLFFDIKKFPTAKFVSDKVEVTGDKTAKVTGMLTLHGVTKPVTLDVTLNGMGKNPITDKDTVGFSATADIKRSDFGINGFLPKLGDEVKLNIEVEANSAT